VADSPPPPFTLTAADADEPGPMALGVDFDLEIIGQLRKLLFSAPAAADLAPAAAATPAPTGAFKAYPVPTPAGPFGYVRIWTFKVNRPNDFIDEFKGIIAGLPQNGLILDVRGNGGGTLGLAEGILQLLTPGPIETERFQLLNTPLTRRGSTFNATYAPFTQSIDDAVETGALYSASLPLTTQAFANQFGQTYQGPVVVITDALCYSATDTFAAGFQDNEVGQILGVHRTTGGGGASVWEYSDILQFLAGPGFEISALPKGSSFRMAVSRNLRVKKRADVLIEELGVAADLTHEMTRNDVLNTANPNEDLIGKAISLLQAAIRHTLTATVTRSGDGEVAVTATSEGVDRIDAFVDGRPGASVTIAASPTTFTLSGVPTGKAQITLNGCAGPKLVAATRLAVS
jgi:hypothetical protein